MGKTPIMAKTQQLKTGGIIMTHRKRSCILLAIALVLILLGSIFSNAINTDFGKIKTDRL